MDETTQATHAKDEFFSADMYVFHVTGFPPPLDVLTRKAEAPPGARLDVWRTDPASDRHIPARAPRVSRSARRTSPSSTAATGPCARRRDHGRSAWMTPPATRAASPE